MSDKVDVEENKDILQEEIQNEQTAPAEDVLTEESPQVDTEKDVKQGDFKKEEKTLSPEEIVDELKNYDANVDVYDPWVDTKAANKEYDIDLTLELKNNTYDAIIITVAHKVFKELGSAKIKALGKQNCIIYDTKSLLPRNDVDGRL